MNSVGFTGTQRGMTSAQESAVRRLLYDVKWHGLTSAHHGDCIGADKMFHQLATLYGFCIVIHPCNLTSKRAYCTGYHAMREVKLPLERNHDIVNESDVMIATPKGMQPELRSGTWATIRYAQKVGKPLAIVYPNGATARDSSWSWGE